MKTLITGSLGLVGSSCVDLFLQHGEVIGIDNGYRDYFFGTGLMEIPNRPGYRHHSIDIRDLDSMIGVDSVFKETDLIIHCAAQPSHDWASKEPLIDFDINARATLQLLELCRKYCPDVVFVYVSTNKVYGSNPAQYCNESNSVDKTTHSLFGCSKLSADLYVQEYGRYFGMKTVCFRCGCISGGKHKGAEQHGFLAYLMNCAKTGNTYTIYGHDGNQVRDNIHADDLANAFYQYYLNPRIGEVYNIGGGKDNAISMHEAIKLCQEIVGKPMFCKYDPKVRKGDHYIYITDYSKFKSHYPEWKITKSVRDILIEIYEHT